MTKGRNLDEKDLRKISGGSDTVGGKTESGSSKGGGQSGPITAPIEDDEPEP
jgi:hypothetical protein